MNYKFKAKDLYNNDVEGFYVKNKNKHYIITDEKDFIFDKTGNTYSKDLFYRGLDINYLVEINSKTLQVIKRRK